MKGWKPVKITQVANIVSGSTPKGIDDEFIDNGEIPYYRVSDMNQLGNEVEMVISNNKLPLALCNKLNIKVCPPGTIIFPKRGGAIFTNKKRFLKTPSAFDLNTMGLVPNEKVDKKFFFYWFSSVNIIDLADGSSVPQLNNKQIEPLEILLPPLFTQKRIAAILDAADEYRQKTKTLIEKYDQLAQSLFLEMFGNGKGKKIGLNECCEINPKKSEIAHIDKDTEVSFIPMSNISNKGALILTEKRRLLEVWNGFTYFKENDVVFAKITPCMENGKGAIMRNLKNQIGFGTTEFHVLRPIPSLTTSTWLYYLTSNNEFRKQAEKNMTGSAGQKRVPTDFFSKYKVICPPITLQNQFAERIQLIDEQKHQAQASLQKSEDLFNSLLQKAFKGELVAE